MAFTLELLLSKKHFKCANVQEAHNPVNLMLKCPTSGYTFIDFIGHDEYGVTTNRY